MTDEKKLSTNDIAAADRSAPRAVTIEDPATPADDQPRTSIETPAPLFSSGDASGYRTRWGAVQTGFVDEPRKAVEEADALVAEVMKRLAEGFAEERKRLEGNGNAPIACPPKTSARPCAGTGPSSSACCRCENPLFLRGSPRGARRAPIPCRLCAPTRRSL